MKSQVTVGLIGFGVVGSGTVQLLKDHRDDIEARVGAPIRVKWVCSRSQKKSPLLDKSILQTKKWEDVVSDPEVDCVVELIGGTNPAREIIKTAIKNGKHVVTANKAVLSKYWNEIFSLAQHHRKLVYFEAAVGGGVPIVQAINEGLAGNRIRKIIGILNGTTNFILTRMHELSSTYAAALKEAQHAGFAEADPDFDVEGIDAAQKISILGSLATGQWVPPQHVYTEGISKLKSMDIRLIRQRLGSAVKLLAIAEETPRGWIFRVHPTLISLRHPFANIRNEYNAVSVYGNAVSDVMLSGKGAGRLPTSSAVVSDTLFLCRQIANGTAGRLPIVSSGPKPIRLSSMDYLETRYYMRVTTHDRPGVLSKITGILGRHRVSLASVHQDNADELIKNKGVSVILVTHISRETDVQAAVRSINQLSTTKGPTVLLRME